MLLRIMRQEEVGGRRSEVGGRRTEDGERSFGEEEDVEALNIKHKIETEEYEDAASLRQGN